MLIPKQWILSAVIAAILAAGGIYYATLPFTWSGCETDIICDRSGFLGPGQKLRLNKEHAEMLVRYDIDFRLYTGQASAGSNKALFDSAPVGAASKSGKGALLLIDFEQSLVRFEFSPGLEGVFTPDFVDYLQQRHLSAFLNAGELAAGIFAATGLIAARAKEAGEGKSFTAPAAVPTPGAPAAVAGEEPGMFDDAPAAPAAFVPAPSALSPEEVVAEYHKTLAAGDKNYGLQIYSEASRAMLQQMVISPAQMQNEAAAYSSCSVEKTAFLDENRRAVVRYRAESRACAPYFLVKENEAWRLDLVTAAKSIKFNAANEWHFDMSQPVPYANAFRDWKIDANGVPSG